MTYSLASSAPTLRHSASKDLDFEKAKDLSHQERPISYYIGDNRTPPSGFLPGLTNTTSNSWYEDVRPEAAGAVSSTSSPAAVATTTSNVDSPSAQSESSSQFHDHHIPARAAADSLLTESYFRSAVSNPYFSHMQGYHHQANVIPQGKQKLHSIT